LRQLDARSKRTKLSENFRISTILFGLLEKKAIYGGPAFSLIFAIYRKKSRLFPEYYFISLRKYGIHISRNYVDRYSFVAAMFPF